MIERISQFHLVNLQLPTYNGKHQPATCYVADRFDGLRPGNIEESSKIADGHTIGCIDLFEHTFRLSLKLGSHKFSLFTVGCIIAAVADHGIIFTSFSDSYELL